jgi:uncharacterized protein (DUF305 family)
VLTFTSLTSSRLRRWAATTALSITVILSGCSDGSAGSAGSSGDSPTFNEADVKFAQTMIPHHEQSIEMTDMILGKTGVSSEVTQLAQAISETQRPQMETLSDFLAAWNQPLIPDHASEAHEDHWAAEGVLTPEEMQEIGAADGSEAQKLFLQGMIQHHEGAVTMVQDEIDNGENPDAVQLAQTIMTGQTSEIETMKDLLADT